MKKLILISNSFSFILDYKIPIIEHTLENDPNHKIVVMVPNNNYSNYQEKDFLRYKDIMKNQKTIFNIKRGNKLISILSNVFSICKFLNSCKNKEAIYMVSHTATINLSLLLSSIFYLKRTNIFFRYVITGFGPSKIRKSLRSRFIGRIYIKAMQIAASTIRQKVITLNKQDRDIIQDFIPTRKVFLLRESGISKNICSKYLDIKKPPLNKIKIVYVGRFLLEKGISDLELVSTYLDLAEINHEIVAFGSSDNFNNSCVSKNSISIQKNKNIIFKNPIPYNEIFNDAHFFVFPSSREGQPKLVPLAMALKCIPVAAPNPGLDVDIINQFNGLISITPSPSSIASEIIKVIKNPLIYENILKGCITYVRKLSELSLNEQFLDILLSTD